MTKQELAQAIELPLFADRENLRDAIDYAYAVAKGTGKNQAHVITAIHVILNTLAKEVRNLD